MEVMQDLHHQPQSFKPGAAQPVHGGGPGSTKGGLGLRVSGYRLVVEGLGFRVETQGEKKSRGRGHS